MYIPTQDRAEERLYALLGLHGVRQEEYSAAVGLLTGDATELAAKRDNFVNRIARAWADGDRVTAFELLHDAQELGFSIDNSSVQRELETITQERLETIRRQQPIDVRYQR